MHKQMHVKSKRLRLPMRNIQSALAVPAWVLSQKLQIWGTWTLWEQRGSHAAFECQVLIIGKPLLQLLQNPFLNLEVRSAQPSMRFQRR